jgi:hypothetical protein
LPVQQQSIYPQEESVLSHRLKERCNYTNPFLTAQFLILGIIVVFAFLPTSLHLAAHAGEKEREKKACYQKPSSARIDQRDKEATYG